jgi:hypothetical protein
VPTPENAVKTNRFLILALAINFTLAILFQLPMLRDPQVIDEDFRSNFWLHRISDPQLFEEDPVYGRQMADIAVGGIDFVVNKVSLPLQRHGSLCSLCRACTAATQ